MGRRRKKVFSVRLDSSKLTEATKPKYNGFLCGYGVHGDIKYNRNKEKQRASRDIHEGLRDLENE